MKQRKLVFMAFSWKRWVVAAVVCLGWAGLIGCDKSGEVDSVPVAGSSLSPTISNLVSTTLQLSKSKGGILRLSCRWASPNLVSTASAYLAFVQTLQNPVNEPTGVISSGTATTTASLLYAGGATRSMTAWPEILSQTASSTASSTAAFYARFKDPIVIPSNVGTSEKEGSWYAEITFPTADIGDAPVGKQLMLFWLVINGQKTNTLAFEIEFAT